MALTERQTEFFTQIDYLIRLIASRHATVDTILKDARRVKTRFVRIPHFQNLDDLEDIFLSQQYADSLVRTAVNRCALLLNDEVKRVKNRGTDPLFERLVDGVEAVHKELDDFIKMMDSFGDAYPAVTEETKLWYAGNNDKFNEMKKKVRLGRRTLPTRTART